ncbi:Exportin-T [Erysiphe necator]|nr:Exportin-T [Erysiphe necator]
MDIQIQNAVNVAWDPSSSQDIKMQALEFLNQLRSFPSGRQACVTLFIKVPPCSDVVRLVCLDVINNAIQSQQLDFQSFEQMKGNLLNYITLVYGSCSQEIADPAHIQNKLTQTLTLLFMKSYKHGWESFFDYFLTLTCFENDGVRNNIKGTMLYLRILGSIHDEIGDVHISRSNEDNRCNSELKDAMRARDVPKIVSSWQEILTYWQNQDDVVETCLKVIGKWVSWIDISLIMNQDLLNTLFQFVGQNNQQKKDGKVRDIAIGTFTEIVAKKMKPSDKIALILFLNLGEVISQLIRSPPLHELRTTSSYDTDLAETVAKLINNVISDVVKILDEAQNQSQSEVQLQAQQLIQSFLPLLLRFLSDEYDEICSTVIPSLTEFLTFLRKSKPLPVMYTAMLQPILKIVIQKMRYDDTSSWGKEDEQTDEAEFQELRKRLQVLQKGVAAVDESLCIEVVSNVVGNTFQMFEQQHGQMDWRDLDLALHEMNIFGEFALSNCSFYIKNQPASVAAERLAVLISKMIDAGIASYTHPAIKLQYMEICVRYYSFFENQTTYIPIVLEQFVQFVHHSHIRVRTRAWYLFSRFVKHLQAHIGNMTEKVIESISDLLLIRAELPNRNIADDISSEESDVSLDANFNAQLNLFESIGSISSATEIPVENQVLYVRTIIEPLFSEIERNIEPSKSGNLQSILQVHHVMMALGYLAHGFSAWVPKNATALLAPSKVVREEFARVAEVILISLEALKSSFDIRTAARACFSRLMGVLGTDMLTLIPRWIDGLLSESSSKDEVAMSLRLLDQVVFSFKKDIYGVLDSLITPLLQKVFAGLAEPISGTDDEIQLAELRREYLTFIQVILNNELGIVLISESNQGIFEHLIHSISNLARTLTNETGSLIASRLAFSVITLMAHSWGGPDIIRRKDSVLNPKLSIQSNLPGFDRFLIEKFHPICWEVLRLPTFRPTFDAQCKQILNEIAGLEYTIYTKTGDLFLHHLQQDFFPLIGVDGSDFIQILKTSPDRKCLAKCLQDYIK